MKKKTKETRLWIAKKTQFFTFISSHHLPFLHNHTLRFVFLISAFLLPHLLLLMLYEMKILPFSLAIFYIYFLLLSYPPFALSSFRFSPSYRLFFGFYFYFTRLCCVVLLYDCFCFSFSLFCFYILFLFFYIYFQPPPLLHRHSYTLLSPTIFFSILLLILFFHTLSFT